MKGIAHLTSIATMITLSAMAAGCGEKSQSAGEQFTGAEKKGKKSDSQNAGQTKDPKDANGKPGADGQVASTGTPAAPGAVPGPGGVLVIDPAVIMADYPKTYCENVNTLELKADVSEEMAFFCKDGVPTADMRDMRKRLLKSDDRRTVVQIIRDDVDDETDSSDFIVVWGYYVAKRPFDVKGLPFFEFIAKDTSSPGIVMGSTATRRPDEELTSGLHLWSADMTYELTVQATADISLTYSRDTQYNLYQVQSGNEEMGLGVETLSNPDEQNYTKSVMLNLSFNDGDGFNDGKGETLVLNLLHITLNNRGFPKTAAGAFDTMANFLADSMFEGLSK